MKTNSMLLMVLSIFLFFGACSKNKKTQELSNNQTSEKTKVTIEKSQQDISIKTSHKHLIINNPHGNIYIRKTSEPFIGILSTMQLIGDSSERADIKIKNKSNTIKLNITYPSDKTLGVNELINGHVKGRVDLLVYVPSHLKLKLVTTYGSINVKRVDNDIDLYTTTGSVKFSSKGRPNITTVSGDVYAYLINPNWKKESKITSISGNLVITFPELSSLNLKASSNNSIQNNFNVKSTLKNQKHFLTYQSKNTPLSITNTIGSIKLVDMSNHKVKLSQEEKTP